jgi:hypothetical protein
MTKKAVRRRFSAKQITTAGMISAISVVLGITGLGYTPLPPFGGTIRIVNKMYYRGKSV